MTTHRSAIQLTQEREDVEELAEEKEEADASPHSTAHAEHAWRELELDALLPAHV